MAYTPPFHPRVAGQLVANRVSLLAHAAAQTRLDKLRTNAAARAAAAVDAVRQTGVARNALLGLLPGTRSPTVRKKLALAVNDFTALKSLRADAKALR